MRVSILTYLFVAFFVFGTLMCLLTIVLLAFPGSFLEPLWRLNPDAHRAFESMGAWAFVLMSIVGVVCAMSALGLALQRDWGRWLAIAVLFLRRMHEESMQIFRSLTDADLEKKCVTPGGAE